MGLHISRLKIDMNISTKDTTIDLDTLPIDSSLKEAEKKWIMEEIKLEIDSMIRYGPSIVTAREEKIDQPGRFLFFILLMDTSVPIKGTRPVDASSLIRLQ